LRVLVPGVRQRRDDDGDRARDRDSTPVRDRRWVVDGREPRRGRDPAGDPRAWAHRRRAPAVTPIGIGVRDVLALAREAREPAEVRAPLLVTGVLAEQLARE